MSKEKRTMGMIAPSYRYFNHPVACRAKEGSTERMIGGYATKFDSVTNLGYMTESIAPGAFDDVLKDDVRCLFNHDPSQILGRTTSGTCRLSLDETGLLYEVDISSTSPIAAHVADAVSRGDVSQSSFAFTIKEEKWEKKKNNEGFEYYHRTVLKVGTLYDVSPVTYPAYEDATVEELSRSLESFVTREMPDEVGNLKQIRSRFIGEPIEDPAVKLEAEKEEKRKATLRRELKFQSVKVGMGMTK